MAEGISLIILKGEQGYDVSQLVEKVKWRGRKGSSARTLAVTLIDDDGYKHARSISIHAPRAGGAALSLETRE